MAAVRAAVVAAGLAMASCGDSTLDPIGPLDAGPDTHVPDADAAEWDDGDTGGEDLADVPELPAGGLVVTVVGRDHWHRDLAAVAGAAVALDLPGGGRAEATTGPDGTVAFEGIDWTAGTAAVTAFAEGRGLASRLGIEGSGTETATVELPDASEGEHVEASGFADALTGAGSYFEVWGLDIHGDSFRLGSDWALGLPVGEVVTLASQEMTRQVLPSGRGLDQAFLSRVILESGPHYADTTFDIDLGSTLPASAAAGTFLAPPRPGSPMRSAAANAYVSVYQRVEAVPGRPPLAQGRLGEPTYFEVSADLSSVDFEVEWITWDGSVSPGTGYYMGLPDGAGGGACQAWMLGLPIPGPQDFTFVDVPEILVPEDLLVPHPIGEAVEWLAFDTGVVPSLVLDLDGDPWSDVSAWWIEGPGDATSITVPEPPSSVDLHSIVGMADPIGYVVLVSETPSGAFFVRTASSGYMRFELP